MNQPLHNLGWKREKGDGPIVVGSPSLRIGHTLETFQSAGTRPAEIERLKIEAKWLEIEGAQPFSSLLGIPSGPEATSGLMVFITFMTPCAEISAVDNALGGGSNVDGAGMDVGLVKFLAKVAFSMSA